MQETGDLTLLQTMAAGEILLSPASAWKIKENPYFTQKMILNDNFELISKINLLPSPHKNGWKDCFDVVELSLLDIAD